MSWHMSAQEQQSKARHEVAHAADTPPPAGFAGPSREIVGHTGVVTVSHEVMALQDVPGTWASATKNGVALLGHFS